MQCLTKVLFRTSPGDSPHQEVSSVCQIHRRTPEVCRRRKLQVSCPLSPTSGYNLTALQSCCLRAQSPIRQGRFFHFRRSLKIEPNNVTTPTTLAVEDLPGFDPTLPRRSMTPPTHQHFKPGHRKSHSLGRDIRPRSDPAKIHKRYGHCDVIIVYALCRCVSLVSNCSNDCDLIVVNIIEDISSF